MEQNGTPGMRTPAGEGNSMASASNGDKPAGGTPPDDGAHHRSSHRQRTLKAAKVVLTDWTMIDCTIRDISEGGARLVFGDAFSLPEEFRLLIVSTNMIVPVKLLWQRGLNAGVGFTGPEEPAAARHKPAQT
jgi:hypothetical protein